MSELLHVRVRELLDYDPETGWFKWRVARPGTKSRTKAAAGVVAKRDGYRRVRVEGVLYLAHRLAWFWVHGRWPVYLDHLNMERDDNRLSNLREATVAQNMGNRRAYRNNRSGRKGVWWHTQCGKWAASIRIKGRNNHLGLFDSIDAASQAYEAAAVRVFGEFARTG